MLHSFHGESVHEHSQPDDERVEEGDHRSFARGLLRMRQRSEIKAVAVTRLALREFLDRVEVGRDAGVKASEVDAARIAARSQESHMRALYRRHLWGDRYCKCDKCEEQVLHGFAGRARWGASCTRRHGHHEAAQALQGRREMRRIGP